LTALGYHRIRAWKAARESEAERGAELKERRAFDEPRTSSPMRRSMSCEQRTNERSLTRRALDRKAVN